MPKFVQSFPSHVYCAHVKTFHSTGCSNSLTDLSSLLYSLEASLYCEDGGNTLLRNISNHLSNYKFCNPKDHSLIPVTTFLSRRSDKLSAPNHFQSQNACQMFLEMSTSKNTDKRTQKSNKRINRISAKT